MPTKTETPTRRMVLTRRAQRFLRRLRRGFKLGNDGQPAGREAQAHREAQALYAAEQRERRAK